MASLSSIGERRAEALRRTREILDNIGVSAADSNASDAIPQALKSQATLQLLLSLAEDNRRLAEGLLILADRLAKLETKKR